MILSLGFSVSNAIPSSRFKNNYGSTLSVAAFWTVFLGACLALVAFCVGLIPSKLTYAVAAVLTVLAWIGLAIGSAVNALAGCCDACCPISADLSQTSSLRPCRFGRRSSSSAARFSPLRCLCVNPCLTPASSFPSDHQAAQQRPRHRDPDWLGLHPHLGLDRPPYARDRPVPDRRVHIRAVRRLLRRCLVPPSPPANGSTSRPPPKAKTFPCRLL